ncbi:MAG: alpha/beta hydrolase [Mycobacteriales bacterium]
MSRRERSGRRWLTVAVSAILLAGALVAAGRAAERGPAHLPAPRAVLAATAYARGPGTVSWLSLPASDAPGGVRRVWVYRPPGPDSSTLPVVYLLHGLPGGAGDFAPAVGLLNSLPAGVPRFVLVVPGDADTGAQDTEWANSVNGKVALETWLTGPVIAAVEGSYPRSPAYRALAGFSMGGFAAMDIGLRHPELFGQLVSISGYFHVDDPSHVFGTNPAVLAEHTPLLHAAAARGRRVLLISDLGDSLALVRGQAQLLAAALRAAGVSVTLDRLPGQHSLTFAIAELPTVAAFLAAGWGHPAG